MTAAPAALLILPDRSISFVGPLSGILGSRFSRVVVEGSKPSTATEMAMWMKAKRCDVVVTTSIGVMRLTDPYLEGTQNDNIGGTSTFLTLDRKGQHKILLAPEFYTQFQNGGRFLLDHYLGKLTGATGIDLPPLDWEFVEPQNLAGIEALALRSFLCAVDIETSREGRKITSCSYTFAFKGKDGAVASKTFVVRCKPEDYPFCISAIRILNRTAVAKIFHNGQYDNAYFLRFNAPVRNWLYDTYCMQHALFPELPLRLDWCAGFFFRNFRYWKDESASNLYEYNAKDTHATLWLWIAQMLYTEKVQNQYARHNFVESFTKNFPLLHCGLTGIPIDEPTRQALRAKEVIKQEKAHQSIQVMLAAPGFNPNSSKQVLQMLHGLGHKKAAGTDKKEMQAFAELHPLNQRIADSIKAYRKASKAISTYFDMELYDGRLYYAIDPCGTVTGRNASRESAFWCGTQVQNIPGYARAMAIASSGKKFGAVDKAQAESYCTAFIAQDLGLIHTVTTSPDFHCQNASMFFGIPFEELFDAATGKKLRPDIRDLAKRVNHGANYNMGEQVLLETMGTKAVIDAKRLLRLPANWSLLKVCAYLLSCFDKGYPRIRGDWQQELKAEVQTTGKLLAPDGWTTRTFMQPWKNKPDLNSTVSIKPQGLSSRLVNRSLFRIWRELQLGKYKGKFRLLAQIHDEILFDADEDIADQAAQEVADMMVIPMTINGRLMTIPSTSKTATCWKDLK